VAETVNEPALSDRVPMVKLIVGDTAVMLYVPIITGLSANPGGAGKGFDCKRNRACLNGARVYRRGVARLGTVDGIVDC
jgi:hypothetical protein